MVVEVDGVKSAPHCLSSGAPQGCISSSLYFSMFINDLCSCIRFSKFHFYADNQQIYLSEDRKDLDEMISALNEDLLLNLLKLQAILYFKFCCGHGAA
jgi:hypothetical protein